MNLGYTCKAVIWLGAKIKSKQMGSNHPSVREGVVPWTESQELMLQQTQKKTNPFHQT